MGWFSETKHYVSASVFNLAGDMEKPPNLIGSAVVSSILSGKDDLVGTLQSTLLGSTAMAQRRFFDWAQTSYGLGMPGGDISAAFMVPSTKIHDAMRTALGLSGSQSLQIMTARIDAAEVAYWAEDWIRENKPGIKDTAWVSELDLVTGQVHIDEADGTRNSFLIPDDLAWGLGGADRLLMFVTYRVLSHYVTNRLGRPDREKLFTYRMGSGNQAFDKYRKAALPLGEFFPPLLLRRNNKSLRHADNNANYDTVKEGYRRLYGRSNKLDDLLDSLEESPDIGEVDYCYLVPGVVLDTKDQGALAYLYAFFKSLEGYQEANLVQEHITERENSQAWDAAWSRWINAHDPDNPRLNSPVYDTPAPSALYDAPSAPGTNELRIYMPQLPEFNIRLWWLDIKETQHLGNARHYDADQTRARLKSGRYWIWGTKIDKSQAIYGENYTESLRSVDIFHQYAKNRYSRISIRGLHHFNHVYDGRSVKTSGYDSVVEAGQSSFLIPLHAPTLRGLGLSRATQLSTSSNWLLFQHYKRVELKWYQTKAFKWALAIAAVALSVVTAGASLGATAGILGTNAAVGAAVGASAATAAFVGAAVNAIAGMIVSTLITKASTELFGEKWGAIVGTIASFVALSYGTQYATHGNFAVDWGQMMKAENLMGITSSVGKAYSSWIAADTAQIYDEMGNLKEDYDKKSEEIRDLTQEILGMTGSPFDPMLLTDAAEHFGERRDTFLSRTLLTGSDIAEISLSMIEDFTTATLELPQAIR